jgi:hypothetical protein
MLSDRSLYEKLNALALDDESAQFKFSDRLARENGWSQSFAGEAIGEYKKFVYLAATSPTPVTPSDIVDQVWHLHLTYSRSYWNEMCGAILGKPLHHGPTKGGASEDGKYRDLYAATLETYRREFDQEPPAAFWPPSQARFESAAHQRWVDTRDHLVMSWRAIASAAAVSIGVILLTSAGTALAAATGTTKTGVTVGLALMAALIAFVVALAAASRRKKGPRARGSDSSGGVFVGGCGTSGSKSGKHGDGNEGSGGESGGEAGGGDGGGSGCSGGGGGCSS